MKHTNFAKRLLGSFLALSSAFAMLGANTSAASFSDAKKDLPVCFDSLTEKEREIYVRLRRGVLENEEEIITTVIESNESYRRICEMILYNDDLTFNLSGISAETTGRHSTFIPTYSLDNFTYTIMVDEMEKAGGKIAEEAKKIPDEYSRIEFIHDRIAETTEFFPNEDPEDFTGYAHYAYGALVEGRAVCQGYSAAFSYVCRLSGIKCITVYGTSRGISHSWNKVLCGKKWYNVDVTQDDPVSNFKDNITHKYFMLSDLEIAADHTPKSLMGTDIPAYESIDYYSENKLSAGSNSSALKLLGKVITDAAKNGEKTAEIHLKNNRAFNNFLNYIESKDKARLKTLLKSAKKATGAKINTGAVWYFTDPDERTFTVVIVYKGSKLSDYFNAPELIGKNNLEDYKKMGIKNDSANQSKEEKAVKK